MFPQYMEVAGLGELFLSQIFFGCTVYSIQPNIETIDLSPEVYSQELGKGVLSYSNAYEPCKNL